MMCFDSGGTTWLQHKTGAGFPVRARGPDVPFSKAGVANPPAFLSACNRSNEWRRSRHHTRDRTFAYYWDWAYFVGRPGRECKRLRSIYEAIENVAASARGNFPTC